VADTGMIWIEKVLSREAIDHLIEESLVGMPIATSRDRAARTAEARV